MLGVVVVVVYGEIVPGSAVARGMELAPGNEDVQNGCGRIVNAAKSPSAIVVREDVKNGKVASSHMRIMTRGKRYSSVSIKRD